MDKEDKEKRKLVPDVVDEFLLYLETIKGFSPNTIVSYRNDLKKFMFFCGKKKYIDELTFQDLRFAIPCMSEDGATPATINRYIAAVRTLFAYCRKLEYIDSNPSLRLRTVKADKPYHQVVTDQEMYKVCTSPDDKKMLWPARDKAIFEMLYSSGCRVSELCSLKFSSFSEGYKKAKILGKGSKERFVFFERDALEALTAYLKERKKLLQEKGIEEDPKFIFLNQAGTPLTTGGLTWILSKYTSAEGINHHFSPHDFRHAFATALVNEGLDIRKVQALLGHASVSTTQRYTHVNQKKVFSDYHKAHPHGQDG